MRWKLRAGARWSDGSPITSDDLLFSLEMQPDPLLTRVDRLDERTVDITYSERHSEWLNGFAVFPKSGAIFAADGGRDALTRASSEGKLASNGSYLVADFEQGKRLTLVRNEQFAAMKPVFEKVEARVFEPLEAAKALLAALDRGAMMKALEPAPTHVAWGWRAQPELTLAKSGGLPALGLISLKLNVSRIRSKDQTHALLAQRIVEDLAAVGITVEVVEQDQLFRTVQRGDFEGLALLGRDTTMPGRFLNVVSPSGRPDLSKPAGPHFDAELVERWNRFDTSLYTERRFALEAELQRAWFDRLPMLPLLLTSRLAAVRAELVGPEWGQADSLWWNVAEWHK